MTTYSIFFFSHLSNEEYMIYLIPCRPRGLYNFRPISYAECSETQPRIICEKMKNTKQGKRIVLPVGWQLLCKEKKRSYMLESNWRITIRIRFVSCYEHKDIEGSLIPWTVIRFHFFFPTFQCIGTREVLKAPKSNLNPCLDLKFETTYLGLIRFCFFCFFSFFCW